MSDTAFPGYLSTIPTDECRRLLAAGTVGRIAYTSPSGIDILPVAYRLDGEAIVFVTSPSSLLARLGDGASVSFQIDDVDPETEAGWSVLVHGRTYGYDGAVVPRAWAPGHNVVALQIIPATWAGRAVSAPEEASV